MTAIKSFWKKTEPLRMIFEKLRISILIFIFSFFGANTYLDLNPKWDKPIYIVLHPVNPSNSEKVKTYINGLKQSQFDEISKYMSDYATKYYGKRVSINYVLANPMENAPLDVTEEQASTILGVLTWTLQFRLYAMLNLKKEDIGVDGVIYLNYAHDDRATLNRSTALQRGRVALVNVHANPEDDRQTNMIIAHESLHLFGAQDRYDPYYGSPIFPEGYADPKQIPLYPQKRAEIMGGYIPMNERDFLVPDNLDSVIILQQTAKEVGWLVNANKNKKDN
jgi:hypothetical protein